MKKTYKYFLPLAFSIVLAVGIVLGYFLNPTPSLTKSERKLIEIMGHIKGEYVDEVDLDSLIERTLPDLLHNLDPHSNYISASDVEDENSKLDSSLSGIGIQFQIINDTLRVLEVTSGGPAEKVGIIPGDRIVTVDGESIVGDKHTEKEIISMIRGDKGTHVSIGVKRGGVKNIIKYDVVRGDIPITTIDAAYMVEPGVGYVKVNRFARGTYDEFRQHISELRVKGADSFIIDLRGNGGGYMEPAILMANEFLQPGMLIVETRGRNEIENSVILSDGLGTFTHQGLVVLIDEFSASASEIFAGAIQDNDRGLILGRRSFGKGLVQRPIGLSDGSEMRLTIQRYYTPSGRCIQKTYKPGSNTEYELEVFNRYESGEVFNVDSIKVDESLMFYTNSGRKVYGGGGITPDIFVSNDTSAITSYYINVSNAGLIQKFAYEYCDLNRDNLSKCETIEQMLKKLPPDNVLLNSFVTYASQNGVPARWYYINISHKLIVNQIKAWIARDLFGMSAFFEIYNSKDKNIEEALRRIHENRANPLTINKK